MFLLTLFTGLVNSESGGIMLKFTLRSAYWTLVLFFIGASGLVAADMDARKSTPSSNLVIMSAANR